MCYLIFKRHHFTLIYVGEWGTIFLKLILALIAVIETYYPRFVDIKSDIFPKPPYVLVPNLLYHYSNLFHSIKKHSIIE